jgi:hypothetical protein
LFLSPGSSAPVNILWASNRISFVNLDNEGLESYLSITKEEVPMGKTSFVTVAVCFVLAGCGNPDAKSPNDDGKTSPADTVVYQSGPVHFINTVKSSAIRLRSKLAKTPDLNKVAWLEIGRMTSDVYAVVTDLQIKKSPESREAAREFEAKTKPLNGSMMQILTAKNADNADAIYKSSAEAVAGLEQVIAWLGEYEGLGRRGYLEDEMEPEGHELTKDRTKTRLSGDLFGAYLSALIIAGHAENAFAGEHSLCMEIGAFQSSGLRNLRLISQFEMNQAGRNELRTLKYHLEQIEEHCLVEKMDLRDLGSALKVIEKSTQKLDSILFPVN